MNPSPLGTRLTIMKRKAETAAANNPEAKPHSKEATRMAKKKPKKKILCAPPLSAISNVNQPISDQWDHLGIDCLSRMRRTDTS